MRAKGFLDLPVELRLQIYKHVIRLQVDCTPLRIEHNQIMTVQPGIRPTMRIPWLDLRRTCTTTALELNACTSSSSFLRRPENRIYRFELITGRTTLESITLRHAPCAPAQAEFLVIDLDVTDLRRFWSYGGVPYPVVGQLFQAVNRIFHYGPLLTPLSTSDFGGQAPLLHLRELVIYVTSHRRDSTVEKAFDAIRDLAFDLCASRTLVGIVNGVRVVGGMQEECFAVQGCENWKAQIAESWSAAQFQWDVEDLLA